MFLNIYRSLMKWIKFQCFDIQQKNIQKPDFFEDLSILIARQITLKTLPKFLQFLFTITKFRTPTDNL